MNFFFYIAQDKFVHALEEVNAQGMTLTIAFWTQNKYPVQNTCVVAVVASWGIVLVQFHNLMSSMYNVYHCDET